MWLRCQIGSKSPLANRKARMFCAASLPRKWSIRKICSSSKTSCSSPFSLLGRGQVGAERLLHDDPAVLDQVRVAEHVHHREGGLRRARSGSAAGAARRCRTRPRPRRPCSRSASAPPAPGAQRSRLENSSQPSGSGPSPPYSAIAVRANSTNESRSCSSSEVPTTCTSLSSPDWNRCSSPGQQLALGEVTGRTEEDDGRGGRHGSSLPVCGTSDQTPRTAGG